MKPLLLGLAIVVASITAAHAYADGCAVVRSTPDGFLNLREFPLGDARVVAKLRPGDVLSISDQSCRSKGGVQVCRHDTNWTRVDDALRGKVYLNKSGWVASRFTKGVDCEEVPDSAQQNKVPYVGYWCFNHPSAGDPEPDASLLVSATSFADCANHGGVRFWRGKTSYQLGRFDWRANCQISKIDLVGPKVYRVYSHCRSKDSMFVGDPLEGKKAFEVWQQKMELRWRELEKDSK